MTKRTVSIPFRIQDPSLIAVTFKSALEELSHRMSLAHFGSQLTQDLLLAFTEGVANALRHANEIKKKGAVAGVLRISEAQVEMRIEDHGRGFKLSNIQTPRFKSLKESGRGIFMMRQLMDSVEYRRGKGKNTLILKRNLASSDPDAKTLDLLYEISDAILHSPDMESVYRVILDKAIEVFHVEKASILLYDKSSKRLKVVAQRGLTKELTSNIAIRPGEGISGYVFRHAKPCLIEDIEKNPSGWKKKKKYKSRSFISAPMICSPMRLGQESIGVINMTDRIDGKPFTRKDLRLLTTIANQATAYLHICQLLSHAREVEVIRREMDIARQIQQSYLPSHPPIHKGMEAAAFLDTAQEVGGDYYDLILTGPDILYVVVADVSGHNVAAALTMANFRSQLKGLLHQDPDPGEALTFLNRSLYGDLIRHEQFISLIMVRLSLKTWEARVASAGHRAPLIIRQGRLKPMICPDEAGLILGGDENEVYASLPCQLQNDDRIVCYTDGVTEASNASGERFGETRFHNLLLKKGSLSAAAIIEAVKSEMKTFRGSAPVSDDVTLVSLRLK